MDKKTFFLILAIGSMVTMITAQTVNASYTSIPPTPAFSHIATNDTDATTNPAWVNATKYNDDLWIISDGSILIEVVPYTGGAE